MLKLKSHKGLTQVARLKICNTGPPMLKELSDDLINRRKV